jgi:integrase
VSRQLGHASVSITADVYGHPDDEAAVKASELLARTIEGN